MRTSELARSQVLILISSVYNGHLALPVIASRPQLATLEELVACFEDLEDQLPQVLDPPKAIPLRDVIQCVSEWIHRLIGQRMGL
jgi:hypothetical protein